MSKSVELPHDSGRRVEALDNRIYVYVDGESHFLRSEEVVIDHGTHKNIEEYAIKNGESANTCIVKKEIRFFWTDKIIQRTPHISRLHYFTTFVGADGDIHDHCEFIRRHGFDPYVTKEDKGLRKSRMASLETCKLIEKPKGVDIALGTKMIEDAVRNNYDTAFLFTSDSDFLPVIKAVKGLGKIVHVFGIYIAMLAIVSFSMFLIVFRTFPTH